MYKLMLFVFALSIVSSTSFARSRFCSETNTERPVKKCKKGDIIIVPNRLVPMLCDFNKQIMYAETVTKTISVRWFTCVYIGYERKVVY